MISGVLYCKSFLEPRLRCVHPFQAEYIVREIHEGSCSMHSIPRVEVWEQNRLLAGFGIGGKIGKSYTSWAVTERG
ncbi:hypothetical protein Tco_0543761 [Tanacetum coccineum]